MFQYLLRYIKRYKWWYIIGSIFIIVKTIISSIVPKYVQKSIDLLNTTVDNDLLSEFVIMMMLLSVVSGIFLYAMRRITITASRHIENDIRNDFFAKLLSLDMYFFHHNKTGDLMARATNDLNNIRSVFGPAIMYTVNLIFSFTIYLYMMISISPRLTFWAVLPIPVMSVVVYVFGRVIYKKQSAIQANYSLISTYAQENLAGARVIKSFSLEEKHIKGFKHLNNDYYNKMTDFLKIQNFFHPSIAVIVSLGLAAILYIGGRLVISNELTIGEFTAFILYLGLLTWPSVAIGWVAGLYQTGASSVERVNKILDQEPNLKIVENENSFELQGNIKFNNLSFRYPETDHDVLKKINLEIKAGESLGIIGPVGSGKSTLINLICKLYQVSHKQILMDGYDINDIPSSTIGKNVSIVPQESFLFSETIKNNILFGNETASDKELKQVIQSSALADTISDFKDGIETMLGERGINLSGGQKQRVSIARALLKNSKILIFDDCLSAVDTQTEEMILTALMEESKNKTNIIISHRISSLKHADHIIYLEDGEIIEEGSHQELVILGKKYATLNQKQLLEQELDQL
jgi:ATP-binding cassette, subfamily B, multidrug efflux pump